MEKLRSSSALKSLCYVLIPILVAILLFSIYHAAFVNEYGDLENGTEYLKSEQFADNYFYKVSDRVAKCRNEEEGESSNYIEIEGENGQKIYYCDNRWDTSYYGGIPAYINYIVINRETGDIFTNIKTDNYETEKEEMKNNTVYWFLENNAIDTNIELLNQDNLKYSYEYAYYVTAEDNGYMDKYDIYTSYDETNIGIYTNYGINKILYQYMLEHKTTPIYSIIVSGIALIIIAIYLVNSIGHKEGTDEIVLNRMDEIPYEIVTIVGLILLCIFLSIAVSLGEASNAIIIAVGVLCYLICYAICAIWGVTTIKRIKAKQFLKSFLTYRIIRWIYRKIKKYFEVIDQKASGEKRLFRYYLIFLFVSILLATTVITGIGILLLIIFWIWVYYKMKKYIIQQDKIKNALKEIYEGKQEVYLSTDELEGVLKEMAIYVNDIAGGFSNAIAESMKSERLKTELITNVSHDIKTPLTSIINYVDLLKKEEIENDKIKEYIEILDKKSQRLKKLTEDLIEASKVSSGSVKLNIESINIKELFNQCIGEFKDKFEEKNLKIEVSMPNKEIRINADNRYMYRIIENLFSNITKYALEASRVYIDMEEEQRNLKISIKNISKDKLNISSDELMQRFVRGDRSRYTEGSGLGLSIAKSLTELQGGTFNISIDGDLFKVDMTWKEI